MKLIPVFPIERDMWTVRDPDTCEVLAACRWLRHAEQVAVLLSEEREGL